MQHLDEGTIHAMLDGELPFAERADAEAHIATCAECAAAVAEARGFIAGSSRILMALDSVPGRVVPEKKRAEAGTFHTPPRITMTRGSWLRAGSAIAAVLVLSTIAVIATRPGGDDPLAKLGHHDELKSLRRPAEQPAANAPTREKTTAAAGGGASRSAVDKSDFLSERKDAKAKAVPRDSRKMLADAAPAQAPAAAAPPAPRPESPLVAQAAPTASQLADSVRSRGLVLGSVVSTDSSSPTLVSRDSAIGVGDTVVTTVYDVHGIRLSLIERSPLQANATRLEVRGVRAPVAMKANGVAAQVNSITWSDSTGHTRTLRGALTGAELEAVKQKLFGTTP